jgi:hypothetical protein
MTAGKNNSKKTSMEDIEDIARDIINEIDIADLTEIDIPDDVRGRIESAGAEELDDLEGEFGLDTAKTDSQRAISGNGPPFEAGSRNGLDLQIDDEESAGETQDVDGSFELVLADDRMSATIDLYPSQGHGEPLSYKAVKQKLDSMRIEFGVNYDLLKKLVEKAEESGSTKTGIIIARGKPPADGKNGQIEFTFSESDNIFKVDGNL